MPFFSIQLSFVKWSNPLSPAKITSTAERSPKFRLLFVLHDFAIFKDLESVRIFVANNQKLYTQHRRPDLS